MSNEIRIKAILEDKVSSGLDKIRDRLDTIGGKGTGSVAFGVLAAKGFGFIASAASQAGSAIADFATDSIQKASDLNETLSKSEVVFGDAADGVKEFGKSAATALGLSENAAVGAAATFGNLFVSLGLAPSKIAPMSESLVKLAADLASFNNIAVDDALAKLQSGIVGQERPLRELGVAISAASVDVEAARLGFHKLNGEFTEGQKVQARYSLIFAQTKTAQGDFARTSDGLANQQRILTAQMEDLQAEIGEKLLPVMVSLAHVMNEEVVPAVVAFFDALDEVGQLGSNEKALDGLNQQLGSLGGRMIETAQSTDQLAGKLADDFTGGVDVATHHLSDLADQAKDTKRVVVLNTDAMVDAMIDDADRLINEFFDPIEDANRLIAARQATYAAERARDNAKTRADYSAATRDIIGGFHEQADALTKLATDHKLTQSEVDKFAADARREYSHLSKDGRAKIQALIDKLNELASIRGVNVNVKLDKNGNVKRGGKTAMASGGFLPAGADAIVGEQGIEGIHALSGGGVIVTPNSRTGGGGGMTFVYSPMYSTASPAEAQRFARAATPELIRELRRQGVAA